VGDHPAAMTFIVRLTEAEPGRLTGIVERARTGEKHRFDRLEALGKLIVQMSRRASGASRAGADGGSHRPGPAPEQGR
jgi:hypothetical protein